MRRRGSDVRAAGDPADRRGRARPGPDRAARRHRPGPGPRPAAAARGGAVHRAANWSSPARSCARAQIYESNSFQLAAAAREAGAIAYRVGVVHDDEERCSPPSRTSWSAPTLVITTGGVSAGAYDVVKAVLSKLGTRRVRPVSRCKPGKPQGFGSDRRDVRRSSPCPATRSAPTSPSRCSCARRCAGCAGVTPERRPMVRATLLEAMTSPARQAAVRPRDRRARRCRSAAPRCARSAARARICSATWRAANCFIVVPRGRDRGPGRRHRCVMVMRLDQ